jgi:hypothetical protein
MGKSILWFIGGWFVGSTAIAIGYNTAMILKEKNNA